MATTTVTYAAAMQPRLPRSQGVVRVEQTFHRSVSASAGDIFAFYNLKIPHGAYIHKFAIKSDTSDGAVTWQWGLGGGITSGALFGSTTMSDTAQIDTLLGDTIASAPGYRVSISDDQPIRYCYVTGTQDGAVGSSPTGTISVTIILEYSMVKSGSTG